MDICFFERVNKGAVNYLFYSYKVECVPRIGEVVSYLSDPRDSNTKQYRRVIHVAVSYTHLTLPTKA